MRAVFAAILIAAAGFLSACGGGDGYPPENSVAPENSGGMTAGNAAAPENIATPENAAPPSPPSSSTLEQILTVAFFYTVNAKRTAHGVDELIWVDTIAQAARAHTQELVDYDRWEHIGIDGSNVATRLERLGVGGSMAGENIGGGTFPEGYDYTQIVSYIMYGGAARILEPSPNSWMGSPGHRENLLSPEWSQTGIGVVQSPGGTRFEFYVTQKFVKYP